jgi:hypothetical protein
MKRSTLRSNLIKAKAFALICIIASGCNSDDNNTTPPVQDDVLAFEETFSKTLHYNSDNTIKLIGYKKIKIAEEDLQDFNSFYKESKGELSNTKNYFYDQKNGILRAYFPVDGALIEYHHGTAEANEQGELAITYNDIHNTGIYVLGRKQTKEITGVEGNIIRDGVIYLSEKQKMDHRQGNIYVFDFGDKVLPGHHDHSSGRVFGKASCMSNHGGPNCSNAFGIRKGRCTFRSNVCMDYNGIVTDCKNHASGWKKYRNFVDSDCDVALARGKCWNEIM